MHLLLKSHGDRSQRYYQTASDSLGPNDCDREFLFPLTGSSEFSYLEAILETIQNRAISNYERHPFQGDCSLKQIGFLKVKYFE